MNPALNKPMTAATRPAPTRVPGTRGVVADDRTVHSWGPDGLLLPHEMSALSQAGRHRGQLGRVVSWFGAHVALVSGLAGAAQHSCHGQWLAVDMVRPVSVEPGAGRHELLVEVLVRHRARPTGAAVRGTVVLAVSSTSGMAGVRCGASVVDARLADAAVWLCEAVTSRAWVLSPGAVDDCRLVTADGLWVALRGQRPLVVRQLSQLSSSGLPGALDHAARQARRVARRRPQHRHEHADQ